MKTRPCRRTVLQSLHKAFTELLTFIDTCCAALAASYNAPFAAVRVHCHGYRVTDQHFDAMQSHLSRKITKDLFATVVELNAKKRIWQRLGDNALYVVVGIALLLFTHSARVSYQTDAVLTSPCVRIAGVALLALYGISNFDRNIISVTRELTLPKRPNGCLGALNTRIAAHDRI